MNNSLLLIWTVKGHQQKRKLKFVFGIAYHTYARAFISLSLHILNDYRQTIHRLVIKLTTTIKLLKQDDTETKIILLANIHSKNICLMSLLKNKYHLKATSKHQSYRMQDMIKIEIDNIYRNILVYNLFRRIIAWIIIYLMKLNILSNIQSSYLPLSINFYMYYLYLRKMHLKQHHKDIWFSPNNFEILQKWTWPAAFAKVILLV